MLSINKRWSNIRKTVGITVLLLFLFIGNAGASPPPAILKIDGNEQVAGIGNNCWKEENETSMLCADMVGVITPAEPLPTRSPFTAHLGLLLLEAPEELRFKPFRVTDDDELKEASKGVRVWNLTEIALNSYKQPLEHEPDINLSLLPGLYVLNVVAKWKDKGSVSYGFLVQVNEPEAKITNNFCVVEKPPRFEFFLAIIILLALSISGRKRR